jgi:hypothetical protein
MIRLVAASLAGVAASFAAPWQAAAEPVADPFAGAVYAIGKCFDSTQAPEERPATFAYNCDQTGVMQDMTWSSWDADGANGTGTDSSVECQPNCAEGTRLFNPIAVRAWNPLSPVTPTCPSGVQFYSDMTIAYPDGVPPWINPGTTWDTGTDFVTVDGKPGVHFSGLTPTC